MKTIMNRLTVITAMAVCAAQVAQAQKPALDHSVYDGWKSLSRVSIPDDGPWMYYTVSPQEGDGVLYLENVIDSRKYEIDRVSEIKIDASGTVAVCRISPRFADTRKAKIAKKKPDDMPHDSLCVLDLATGARECFGDVKSVVFPHTLVDHVVYSKFVSKKDTLLHDGDRIVLNIRTMERDTLRSVSDLSINRAGTALSFSVKPAAKDSVTRAGVCVYNMAACALDTLLTGAKGSRFGKMYWNGDGDKFAFYACLDTARSAAKDIDIYLYDGAGTTRVLAHDAPGIPEGWCLSDKASIGWRGGDTYLTVGTAPVPMEKDTSLVDFEQPHLDIWTWNEDYLQPVQKSNLKREQDRTYLATLRLEDSRFLQLADEQLPDVRIGVDCVADRVIAATDKPYRIKGQWDGEPCRDVYCVDLRDGSRTQVATAAPVTAVSTSPDGRKVVYYDVIKRDWFSLDVGTLAIENLTAGLPVCFYDDEDDHPSRPGPTGGATWFVDSRHVAIGERYDTWVFDLDGLEEPYMLAEGIGHETRTTFSLTLPYSNPDYALRGTRIDPSRPVYFLTQDRATKHWGVAMRDLTHPRRHLKILAEGGCKYASLAVSGAPRKGPQLFYTRESFETGRNLWTTADFFKNETQLTDINPQMRDYNWGTVSLMKWKRGDGIDAEALLFKPEDFDPDRKYPVIFYFYEKNSSTLYDARVPAPSRSVINIPFFVSNGYVVCVPDMYYKVDGHPGRDGLESLESATDQLCAYPWVDQQHMGIQGQSWGGYQVAYIITQTDRYAAAGAGAPVSNMTSAYGGIRWGTGISRMSQYEQGQSRIGKDLWNGFDLYKENSPLFFVPRVETPVLIMHNDADGAVPWWQGIEFFNALRRCGKQAWMLQYNGEAHNLVKRPNCKDLSIRLDQFFGHFLKGEPMPVWMSEGVPATRKGLTLGYEKPER